MVSYGVVNKFNQRLTEGLPRKGQRWMQRARMMTCPAPGRCGRPRSASRSTHPSSPPPGPPRRGRASQTYTLRCAAPALAAPPACESSFLSYCPSVFYPPTWPELTSRLQRVCVQCTRCAYCVEDCPDACRPAALQAQDEGRHSLAFRHALHCAGVSAG